MRRKVRIAWAVAEQTPIGDPMGDMLLEKAWHKQSMLGHLLDTASQVEYENAPLEMDFVTL